MTASFTLVLSQMFGRQKTALHSEELHFNQQSTVSLLTSPNTRVQVTSIACLLQTDLHFFNQDNQEKQETDSSPLIVRDEYEKTVEEDTPLLEVLKIMQPHSSTNVLRKMLTNQRVSVDESILYRAKHLVLKGQVVEIHPKANSPRRDT